MVEPTDSLPVPERVGLFEMNLMGDRVQHMRRRVRFFQICSALALVMVVAGGVLAAMTAGHLVEYIRAGQGASEANRQLIEAREGDAELDAQRKAACEALGSVGALTSIARRRVAWAPTLAALAQALPPGGGILAVEAQSGDTFYRPLPPAAAELDRQGKAVPRAAPAPPAPPGMKFSILLSPALGAGDPMPFLERLRKSETFMKRIAGVQVDVTAQDNWMGGPVIVLTGSCAGAQEGKP